MTTPDLSAILDSRGITQIAQIAKWEATQLYGRWGWSYPVTSSKLTGQSRWKSFDGERPKYLWQPKEATERPRYYFLNGLKAAIANDNGRLYIASGEPDVLVYNTAGAPNTLCWFGEQNVPETLVADLKALGVVEAVYAFDRDDTGQLSANEVQTRLDGAGIKLLLLILPGEMGSHYDINKLWIDVEFDTEKFWQRYKTLEVANADRRNPDINWELEYETWCKDIERQAVNAWKIDEQRHKEWSKRHFSSPVRSDSEPSARWNYEAHGFKDFGGTGEFYNTHQVAEILGSDTWDVYKARLLADHQSAPLLFGSTHHASPNGKKGKVNRLTMGERAQKEANEIRIVTSDEAMDTVIEWLNGNVPPTEPILSPYAVMHDLKGMARLWERRKLVYVIGAAGMGKTAFLETGADNLRKRGLSVIYWGPEWSPEEVQMKAIARHGGPSFDKQRDAHLWAREELRKVPADKRHGTPLSTIDSEVAKRVAADIRAWPGKAWYIDKSNLSIELTMRKVIEIAAQSRGLGQDMAAFFCDYLQKAKLPRSHGRWDELENKANVISYACIEADLVGIVASQVGKADSRMARKNTLLDASSAQGLSDQLCNLYITLNPIFDHNNNRLEKGIILVEKNSSGYAPSSVTVKTALYRHYWSDERTNIDAEKETPLNEPKETEYEAPPVEEVEEYVPLMLGGSF